jgi:F-type H+-transporting ATPase subunit delta
MIDQRAVRPYARALFELAQEQQTVERTEADFARVMQVFNESEEFRKLLLHPQASHQAKKETVFRIFGTDIEDATLHFLNVVVDKDREELLNAIHAEFIRLVEDSRGIVQAYVESAQDLDGAQQRDLTEKLSHALGRRVAIEIHHNPALIAGAVIRIGDRVLDGSVLRRMEILGARLRGNGGGLVVEH